MNENIIFSGGCNIAMKVPPHQYEDTVWVYGEVPGLPVIDSLLSSVVFEFGGIRLWIDKVSGISQAELWLETRTNNIDEASEYLRSKGIVRCDDIEPLPEGFQEFWISSPASIIHLVCNNEKSEKIKEDIRL